MSPMQAVNFYRKKTNSDKITHIYAVMAADLNVSVQTVYNWVSARQIPKYARIKLNKISEGKLKL